MLNANFWIKATQKEKKQKQDGLGMQIAKVEKWKMENVYWHK